MCFGGGIENIRFTVGFKGVFFPCLNDSIIQSA